MHWMTWDWLWNLNSKKKKPEAQGPNLGLVCSKTTHFRDTKLSKIGNIGNALNDPQMTLNPTQSNVPHTCVTSIHDFQISLRFALRPAILGIQAIFRQVLQMSQKWSWTLQGQRYPMCYWCARVPYFTPLSSTTQCFWDTKLSIIQNCKWPWTLNS